MNGIAIALNSNMQGESPLGSVTFKESTQKKVAHYVANYSTAIDDSSYNNELVTLFTSIVEAGLDRKLFSLYPMLGNTVAKQKINALNPGTNDLVLGANASVVDGVLTFSSTVGIGDLRTSKNYLSQEMEFSNLIVAKRNAGLNTSILFYYDMNDNGITGYSFYANSISGPALRIQCVNPSKRLDYSLSSITDLFCLTVSRDSEKIEGYIDNTAIDFPSPETIVKPNTFLGMNPDEFYNSTAGSTIERNVNLWEGITHFYAIGKLSATENATLKTIVRTFLNNVKNVAI